MYTTAIAIWLIWFIICVKIPPKYKVLYFYCHSVVQVISTILSLRSECSERARSQQIDKTKHTQWNIFLVHLSVLINAVEISVLRKSRFWYAHTHIYASLKYVVMTKWNILGLLDNIRTPCLAIKPNGMQLETETTNVTWTSSMSFKISMVWESWDFNDSWATRILSYLPLCHSQWISLQSFTESDVRWACHACVDDISDIVYDVDMVLVGCKLGQHL